MGKTDKRVLKNTKSVVEMHRLLGDLLRDPEPFIDELDFYLGELNSQGAFAKMELKDGVYEIDRMSLNTLKSIADEALTPGGFMSLENKRLLALDKLKTILYDKENPKSGKRTFKGLEARVNELEETSNMLRKNNLFLLQVIERVKVEFSNIATTNNSELRIKKANDAAKDASLLVSRVDDSNVIPMSREG